MTTIQRGSIELDSFEIQIGDIIAKGDIVFEETKLTIVGNYGTQRIHFEQSMNYDTIHYLKNCYMNEGLLIRWKGDTMTIDLPTSDFHYNNEQVSHDSGVMLLKVSQSRTIIDRSTLDLPSSILSGKEGFSIQLSQPTKIARIIIYFPTSVGYIKKCNIQIKYFDPVSKMDEILFEDLSYSRFGYQELLIYFNEEVQLLKVISESHQQTTEPCQISTFQIYSDIES
jgi:hypothetical protein